MCESSATDRHRPRVYASFARCVEMLIAMSVGMVAAEAARPALGLNGQASEQLIVATVAMATTSAGWMAVRQLGWRMCARSAIAMGVVAAAALLLADLKLLHTTNQILAMDHLGCQAAMVGLLLRGAKPAYTRRHGSRASWGGGGAPVARTVEASRAARVRRRRRADDDGALSAMEFAADRTGV